MTKRPVLAMPVVLVCLGAVLALGGCGTDEQTDLDTQPGPVPQTQAPAPDAPFPTRPLTAKEAKEKADEALKVCGADRFQDRIGGPLIGSTATQPVKGPFLKASELPQPNRILPPNAVATRDFNPVRLNVFLNNRMEVVRIACG